MGIDKYKSRVMKALELRRQAEKRLQTQMAELFPTRAEEETQKLLHELEVHQLELEMQNRDLTKGPESVFSCRRPSSKRTWEGGRLTVRNTGKGAEFRIEV
jgi:hypothetical protein